MTELIERYEVETGKDMFGFKGVLDNHIVVGYDHVLEFRQDVRNILAWVAEQLRWRPVSEKPEKGQYIMMKITDSGVTRFHYVYWDMDGDEDIVWQKYIELFGDFKWFPIPPAPEVKEIPIAGTVKVHISNKQKQMEWNDTPKPEGE